MTDKVRANRTVTLRAESRGSDRRYLSASIDQLGNLHIDGQDLGPGTASVSDDGEYEWSEVILAGDLPRLKEMLGGKPGDDILDFLETHWSGRQSYELERRLREGVIPVQRQTWSG